MADPFGHLESDLTWLQSDEGKARLGRLVRRVAKTPEGRIQIRKMMQLPDNPTDVPTGPVDVDNG